MRGLRGVPVDVTLVDRRNFHLFQPLLYQVATGALSAGEIATPLRAILKRQRNAHVATIGRLNAMPQIRGVQLSGAVAWLGYLLVHLIYLVGLQNRLLVFIRWATSFATRGRGSRLITGMRAPIAPPRATTDPPVPARAA